MRAYNILPVPVIQAASLSKDALKRLTYLDWYFTHGRNAELTCRHFSISKSVFYRWKNRFNPRNLRSLEFDTKLRRPHKLREMTTSAHILKLIYDIRLLDPTKSKYEIEEELKRQGVKISRKVIQNVINRHIELQNIDHKRKFKKYRNYKIARIKAAKELREKDLGSLIQIDTKHLYILGQRFYVFVAIDCKSRLGFVYAYKTCSSANAADFLLRAIAYFPFPLLAINTDNGPEYLLNFHKLTEKLKIPHYFTHPHTPKMNARAERLIKTLEYEFLNYRELLPELEEVRSICNEFNELYNHKRFHQSLSYKTPSEYVNILLKEKGGQPFSI
jgi:transposase InsO family protein